MQFSDKAAHLLSLVDLDHPALSAVRAAGDPTTAFVEHVARPPRPRFRFEPSRKREILAFLDAHCPRWRDDAVKAADPVAALTLDEARQPRALAGVAELGKAWWATDNPAYGATFEQFYTRVATGDMFNWGSFNGAQGAIELSAYHLLLDCPGFTGQGRIAYLDHLHAIADDAWDLRTSRWTQSALGPEGHNWYLHGTQVLPFIGLLVPEFKRAPFFIRTGAGIFEEHLRGHYRADGGARETALGYQNGSLLNLWDFALVAQRNGYPLSAGFIERLLAATRYLLLLMTPEGALPSFGDIHRSPGMLTTLAATAAALSGDGVCKWFAERCRRHLPGCDETPGQLPACAFWRVGLAGASTYAETRACDPRLTSVLMSQSGYAALRSGAAPDARYLAIAAANRGPIVTSHGHNDVFALDVQALGTRFIGEMGCAPYGDSPGRQYDEKTEAHSTLAIDGMEQAPIANEWRWQGHALPVVRRWISTATHDFFHGVHEGFYRYPDHQTLHARKILFIKSAPSYWLIFDWVESNVINDLSVYFHGCVPGRINGTTLLLGEAQGPRLAVFPPAQDAVSAETVASEGLAAYVAENKLDPAHYPCFAYRKRTASDCLVWALVPLADGQQAPVMVRVPVSLNGRPAAPHEVAAVRIDFAGQSDTVCLSHTEYDAELACGPVKTWGIFAFHRASSRAGAEPLTLEHTVRDGACGC